MQTWARVGSYNKKMEFTLTDDQRTSLIESEKEFRRQAKPGKDSQSHLLCHIRDNWEGWKSPGGDRTTPYINALFDTIKKSYINNTIQGNINHKQAQSQ